MTIPPCPGPDRNVRRPVFTAPRGSWDCHAHVFGPAAHFPFAANRSYTPEDCPAAEYLPLLDTLGFDHGVVVQGGAHGTDNRAMLAALALAPQRLRGVAVLPPGQSPANLAALHRAGVRGLRMSTVVGGGVGMEAIAALDAEIHALGWHLMLHFGKAEQLVDVEAALTAARSPFILDHMARITGAEGLASAPFAALRRLLDTDRCWIKLASLYRLSSEPWPHRDMLPMIHAVVEARPDRILWGSNWPHPIHHGAMPNDADLVDLIPLWVPDPAQQRAMLVDNPRALYAGRDAA
jgi:2-pyrone-4,6-dicarboxylate lactonase